MKVYGRAGWAFLIPHNNHSLFGGGGDCSVGLRAIETLVLFGGP